MTKQPRNALGSGTRLDEYVVEHVLGKPGGFGIAYRARDQFERPVVIKEYFPNELALREGDSFSVRPKSEEDEEFFHWGMQRFLDEARTLSRFDHPGIVKVLRYFERNNTGYFVMPFEDGEDLRARLARGVMNEGDLLALLHPLLDALEEVHRAGIWHRDIKPSNIYLRKKDRSPLLLDFGAARQAMGERSKSMTSVLTPPYAPFEQYSRDPKNQGPWTDIYAVGVVAYEALSGKHPPDSADRIESDGLEPLSSVARHPCSPALADGITAALRVRRTARPQSIAAWRAILFDSAPKAAPKPKPVEPIRPPAGNRSTPPGREIGPLLGLGIVFFPWIFAWSLLRQGYSDSKRIAAFGWLVILLVGMAVVNPLIVQWSEDNNSVPPPGVTENSASIAPPVADTPAAPTPQEALDKAFDAENDKKFADAIHWYRLAADAGNGDAMNYLGLKFADGKGVKQDYGEAMRWYKKAADAGNTDAMANIGQLYQNANGVDMNCDQAMSWYRKSADAGNAPAMLDVGSLYENGQCADKSSDEAMRWYKKAIDTGSTDAMIYMGSLYVNGIMDYAQGMSWYRKAADAGNSDAMDDIGDLYHSGTGVNMDFAQALTWYRKAADGGSAWGMNDLGGMYVRGEAVTQNYAEAMRWYRKAADAGNGNAMDSIGDLYVAGNGVPKDFLQAMNWYRKAEAAGYGDADDDIANLCNDANAKPVLSEKKLCPEAP